VHDVAGRAPEEEQLWLWLHSLPGLDGGVCYPFPLTKASSLLSGLLPLPNFVLVCSSSEFGRKTLGSPSSYRLSMGDLDSLEETIQQATDEVNPIEVTLVRGWYMAQERVMQNL
jgi:hypothetical protein